jgi:hypothetical protein
MKKLGLVVLALALTSCSTVQQRTPASDLIDLEGTRLGQTDHKFFRRGADQAAVRIYVHPIENEPGSYSVVLFEYAPLMTIAPQYVASRNLPAANKVIGYLNKIGQRISAHKMVPTQQRGLYELYPLRVEGSAIIADFKAQPYVLKLANEIVPVDPLGGAKITLKGEDKTLISFPKDGAITGAEYTLAKTAYEKAKLDSTWRKHYLKGAYLAAYGKLDDVVLKLSSPGGQDTATFVNNNHLFKMSRKRRAAIFTHPSSALIEGTYSVSEPMDGMFILQPAQEGLPGAEHAVGRIGLFIDVFDATKSLNQDVVEVAFINPHDPEDFLMYYEHPENGEGENARVRD